MDLKMKLVNQKRTNAEVSTTTAEEISILGDQLEVLGGEISCIREGFKTLVTKEELDNLIKSSISEALKELESKLKKEFEVKLNEKTNEFKDNIESLIFENSKLKESFESYKTSSKNEIEELRAEWNKTNTLAIEAMTQANYNEQYSRKNNIKIMGKPENEKSFDELEAKVYSVLCDQGIEIRHTDIQAIHIIPSKASLKPVLVKLMNNDTKSKVMRHRKKT